MKIKKATVKDLLTMTLGQEKGFLMGKQRPRMEEQNWVKASLAIPFVYEPGTHFVYNNVGPYLAGIWFNEDRMRSFVISDSTAFKTFGEYENHGGGRP